MTEYNKNKTINIEQLVEYMDDYGTLKLDALPATPDVGSVFFVTKITGEVIIKELTGDYAGKKNYKIPVVIESPDYEPLHFNVQVGEKAVLRMMEKNPENSYVGLACSFTKSLFKGNKVQFIHPFVQKEGGFVQKGKLIKKSGASNPEPTPREQQAQAQEIINDANNYAGKYPQWIVDLISGFATEPAAFVEYRSSEARDGETKHWKFIDDFKELAEQNKEADKYDADKIEEIYADIEQALTK